MAKKKETLHELGGVERRPDNSPAPTPKRPPFKHQIITRIGKGGEVLSSRKVDHTGKEVKEETISELSRHLLGRYVKRAASDFASATRASGTYFGLGKNNRPEYKELAQRLLKRSDKRWKGLSRATDKLVTKPTNEEVEEIDMNAVSDNPIADILDAKLQDALDTRVQELSAALFVATEEQGDEPLEEGDNYHTVFYHHAGKWKHHGDFDNRTDASDESRRLRDGGEKVKRLTVPKHEADWNKNDPHEYVTKRLKEETDLQELKKTTIGSYIKKASQDAGDLRGDAGVYLGLDIRTRNNPNSPYNRAQRKAAKRQRGVERATDRLTKEEVELQENKLPVELKKKIVQHLHKKRPSLSVKEMGKLRRDQERNKYADNHDTQ